MSEITIKLGYNIRDLDTPIHNFSLLANVSPPLYNSVTNAFASPSELSSTLDTGWSHEFNNGINPYFKRHNGFKDQELHDRISRGFVLRQGTLIKYYPTTFDVSGDPLFFEDNNRVIQRVFDIPVITSYQPENEIYNKFNIQHLDQDEMFMHMSLFLELNYQSLRRYGIKPACNSTAHNPVWSQLGYSSFMYHGYTADQIIPKPGDKLKLESFDSLYEVESVKDSSPEHQHRGRKYFWKIFYMDAMDQSQTIDNEVLNDAGQQQFINDLMGSQVGAVDRNNKPITIPFARNKAIDKLKKDILFRPPEVAPDVEDITKDLNYYPGGDKLGTW